jgi:hypothetical protein
MKKSWISKSIFGTRQLSWGCKSHAKAQREIQKINYKDTENHKKIVRLV